jgi:hypothetical protein
MKFKQLAIAGAVAALAFGASANDVIIDGVINAGTSGFTITHFNNLDFTDQITFANTGPVFASASLVTIDLGSNQNIDFTSVMLNGEALTLQTLGPTDVAYTSSPLSLTGDLVLTVMGTTNAGAGQNATYSGVLNVAAIPEPETYALMLAGLGAIGFMARRRRSA